MGDKKQKTHTALYRKYRSKTLGEIIGQEHVTKTLENAIKSGKISHAYLFTGPRGVGKTSIARILAHEINSLPYGDSSTHLDIIEIDAASNRRIDDIRDLREKVNLAPVNAKYKVYIIDEVHMLTTESFNALLKTLEEPPAHVVFILATTEVHKLPATIVSRTQRHSFRAAPIEKVTKHLAYIAKEEGIEIDNEALALLAEHGEGSFRDSISLLDQVSHSSTPITKEYIEGLLGIAPNTAVQAILTSASQGAAKETIEQVHTLNEQGIPAQMIARQLIVALRNTSHTATTVSLMKQLLEVGTNIEPLFTLEVALLDFCLKHSEKNLPPTPTAAATTVTRTVKTEPIPIVHKEPTPPTTVIEPAKKESSAAAPIPKKEQSQDDTATWSAVMDEVKQKNSSLYTILRLAKADIGTDSLTISLQFPFHQKRIQEHKYMQALREIINRHIEPLPTIEIVVDPTIKSVSLEDSARPASKPDPAHASLIASVQDIMGGGDIVDVGPA